jgi:hypothetical protein
MKTIASAATTAPTARPAVKISDAPTGPKRACISSANHIGTMPASTPVSGPSVGNHSACSEPIAPIAIRQPTKRTNGWLMRRPIAMAASSTPR